jgi:cytochrome b561
LSHFDAPRSGRAYHDLNLRSRSINPPALEDSEPVRRSHVSRILHLLLLLIVINQLVGSHFMEKPSPGEDAEWPFLLHEWVGMAGCLIITVFWLWTLLRHSSETSLTRLLPWLSTSGWRDLLGDAKQTASDILGMKLGSHRAGALASAVHGLGLLTASAMATSGAAYFLLPAATHLGGFMLELHKVLANFMWAYLIGHASMAVIHAMLGNDVIARMFWFKRSNKHTVEVR